MYVDTFVRFLEWKYFKITTNFAYAFYLTQFTVMYYNIGSKRAPVHFSIYKTGVSG